MYRCPSCGALNRVRASGPGAPVCGRCKRDLDTSGAPQEVDEDGFRRAVASAEVPVLVDFWAPWCGPCKAAAPILDGVARANAGRALVLKLNTDQNPSVSQELGISGIPTFMVFKGGAEVARRAGLMSAPMFQSWLSGVA